MSARSLLGSVVPQEREIGKYVGIEYVVVIKVVSNDKGISELLQKA